MTRGMVLEMFVWLLGQWQRQFHFAVVPLEACSVHRAGVPTCCVRLFDYDADGDTDLKDFAGFSNGLTKRH